MKKTLTTLKTSHCFLLFVLLLGSAGINARDNYNRCFGIRGTASISANRFGTIYCPSLFYKSGNSSIAIGAAIQEHRLSASGLQFNYEYTLLDPSRNADCYIDWLELYTFASVTYYNHASLGKTVCAEEHLSNRELAVDPAALRLKALDTYAGFGLRIALGKNLKWFNAVAIGGYSVFNSPGGLYYNNRALGLLVRTGVSWQFGKHGRSGF
jgi:hypothetical protein